MSENSQSKTARTGRLTVMRPEAKILYQALLARDTRFDGTFFTGVTSTGIYCRPICPVKPPKFANCRFFEHAHEAEQAGFRPCLRCRPELAPGHAPVDSAKRIAHLIVRRIEAGNLEERAALEAVADEFKLSSRQIRRIIQKELGVAPIQLLLTRRLLLAKQLLTETQLPVIEIAFASGFASLRRFNDAFHRRYGLPPTRLRRQAVTDRATSVGADGITLQLTYRPPYDWAGMLAFLKVRELKGVESVTENTYARTVQLGTHRGWIRITPVPGKNALSLELSHGLIAVLPGLLRRVRELFDLDARPDVIVRHFNRDKHLAKSIRANPGLRVPGAFDGFELGWRAILGQQITVKAATTMAARVVMALGEKIVTPYPELNRLTPSAERIATASGERLAKLGMVKTRCQSLIALAKAQASGELSLDDSVHPDPEDTISRLVRLPGIGQWTAHYMAMRALRWPDAFPKEDLILRQALGGVTAKQASVIAEAWRPWRSYAVLHLWRNAKSSTPSHTV